jgi:hypothetical protein
MTYTVNPERGEVALLLEGEVYPMRPSYDAMMAIEQQLGSLVALSYRHASPLQGLTMREMSVVACEAIKEAGRERGDEGKMLRGVTAEKICKLIAAGGPLKAIAPIEKLLDNMITGGTKPKKEDAGDDPAQNKTA